MFSPRPRNKRAKNPRGLLEGGGPSGDRGSSQGSAPKHGPVETPNAKSPHLDTKPSPSSFVNNPFSKLDLNAKDEPESSSAES
jgi:hypothetical protein